MLYALDYFNAGVPPGALLKLSVSDLNRLATSYQPRGGRWDVAAEVCLIGLVAYFEAFCKNAFAAAINVYPKLLMSFTERRAEVKIRVRDLLMIEGDPHHRIGFLLAEQYDFGSAKAVNGLFQDLLSITPFSAAEARQYAHLLSDRNLLVHHGGVYTSKYQEQRLAPRNVSGQTFFDSLVVTKDDYFQWTAFLEDIAEKMLRATAGAIREAAREDGVEFDVERAKALDYLSEYEL